MPLPSIQPRLPHAEPMHPADPDSLFAMAVGSVNAACDVMNAGPFVKSILSQPKNELIVNFPVMLDDGSYRLFKGYRIQHNNILGPYKGGVRAVSRQYDVDLATAAFCAAVEHIAASYKQRGIFP